MRAHSAPVFAVLALLALLALPSAARATIPDPRFDQSTVVVSGLGQPTQMARAPDGSNRIFVNSKGGRVLIVEDGVLLGTPFFTITPLYTASECGVLGIAFDPDYVTNRYVYVFATVSASEQRIIRLTDVSDLGQDPTPIVTGLPTIGANHDGGGLGFGWDGNLYWSIGDNGSGRGVNADLSLLAAKIGRAKPDGTVPADNPFIDGPGGNDDYIYARGFRNPFTLMFEPARGRLWVNTVGSVYEQVFIVHLGDHAGWNTYENNQPANYIAPVIKYRTNGTDSRSITAGGALRSGGVLTVTTSQIHGFRRGERITLAGIGDGSMNGDVFVTSVPNATSFTAQQAGADAMSGGGSATTPSIGGCITGGIFYDGTDFPPEYQGNFFFGDYNAGNLMRTTLDGNGDVDSVDFFGSNLSEIVDTEIGADGQLYILLHGNSMEKVAFVHTAQDLILSNTHLRMVEGGRIGFAVSLATPPLADVTVTVRNAGGDPDVEVEDGASLTFTPGNWDQPQPVILHAVLDFDSTDDASTIAVESTGLTTQNVSVTVRDNNTQSIVLSTTMLEVPEGSASMFQVSLANMPDVDVPVTITTTSSKILISGGNTLTFTGLDFMTPQNVTVAAYEDADASNDTATIQISSPSAAPRTIAVVVRDNDTRAPAFTSTPPSIAIAGTRYRYDAEATGLPAPSFVLDTAPPGVIFDRATGELSFIPHQVGSFSFVLRATNGIQPDAVQSWSIIVAADVPPEVMVVKPEEGATLSGAENQWYGNGTDDVGVARAEFSIDGTVAYTETSSSGRYEYGGGANRFDTTALSNGAHTLRLTIFDTSGQSAFADRQVTVSNPIAMGDGGTMPPPITPGETSKGCGCSAAQRSSASGNGAAVILVLALGACFVRKRRS